MRIRLLHLLCVLLACRVGQGAADVDGAGPAPLGPAAPPTTLPATAHDIALAVAQLGDDDPQVRDDAMRKLGMIGSAALPALRQAANGDDPEVANRARRLLAEFRFGIDPETPAPLMELVNLYRREQGQARQQAIDKLGQLGWPGYRVLARLRRMETDAASREALASPLRAGSANVLNSAREMILAGREDDAEARLADAASGGNGAVLRSYAALALARGQLEQMIHETTVEAGETPGADDAMLLAYLYRAKGDDNDALRYARMVPAGAPGPENEPDQLVREVLLNRHDWAGLMADVTRRANEPVTPDFQGALLAERLLAEKLSYARLAGDTGAVNEAVAAIHQAAGQSPDRVPAYADVLFLNDRSAEGIDLLVKGKFYHPAYQLMVSQGRYEDAAKLLADARTDSPLDLPVLELSAARRLQWLGDTDAAAAIVDRLEKEIPPDSPSPVQGDVIETELALGRADKACDRAATVMAAAAAAGGAPNNGNTVEIILGRLVPKDPAQALAWRGYLADQHPSATPGEILQKLWALYAKKLPDAEAESILRDAAGTAPHQNPADRAGIYQRLTQTAQTIGRDDLADEFFEKWAADPAAAAIGGSSMWSALGDRAMAKKDYARGIDFYDKALQRSPQEPTYIWLHGWAMGLAAAGDAERAARAKAQMRRADECLLADDAHWLPFLQAIGQAGADSTGDAEGQRQLMRRLCGPGSWAFNESLRLSAAALAPPSENNDETPDSPDATRAASPACLQAADLISRWMLKIAHGELQFNVLEAYLIEPAGVHSIRARGLVAAGDIAAAMKEADLSLSSLPANSQLPIELVPALDRGGHRKEADALFNKVAAVLEAGVARHPRAAELHNNLAWMCAKCDRELDKALANAQAATTLAPDTVAYLDTLAEVQFHLGQRQAAIDTMKHCIELDPRFEYLKHQLKRFTSEEPTTKP